MFATNLPSLDISLQMFGRENFEKNGKPVGTAPYYWEPGSLNQGNFSTEIYRSLKKIP